MSRTSHGRRVLAGLFAALSVLTLLTGCDVSDSYSAESMLAQMSKFNDAVQAKLFNPNALAPTFGGQKNALAALKLTAYSFTPAWVAAILTILPALGLVAALVGLYGLYLLYLGLPVLMRAPADRALGYTVVIVLCAIVVNIIIVSITALVTGGLFAGV